MEDFLKEIKIIHAPDLASRLWNADETGFCASVACQMVLAQKGSISRCTRQVGGVVGITTQYWELVLLMAPDFHHSFCTRVAICTFAGRMVDQREQYTGLVTVVGWRATSFATGLKALCTSSSSPTYQWSSCAVCRWAPLPLDPATDPACEE